VGTPDFAQPRLANISIELRLASQLSGEGCPPKRGEERNHPERRAGGPCSAGQAISSGLASVTRSSSSRSLRCVERPAVDPQLPQDARQQPGADVLGRVVRNRRLPARLWVAPDFVTPAPKRVG